MGRRGGGAGEAGCVSIAHANANSSIIGRVTQCRVDRTRCKLPCHIPTCTIVSTKYTSRLHSCGHLSFMSALKTCLHSASLLFCFIFSPSMTLTTLRSSDLIPVISSASSED